MAPPVPLVVPTHVADLAVEAGLADYDDTTEAPEDHRAVLWLDAETAETRRRARATDGDTLLWVRQALHALDSVEVTTASTGLRHAQGLLDRILQAAEHPETTP